VKTSSSASSAPPREPSEIARYKDPTASDDLVSNWLRNRNTIEFFVLWEQINNPGFNPIEFDGIRKQASLNSFILTADERTPQLPGGKKGK
jgi:hypothetical protein